MWSKQPGIIERRVMEKVKRLVEEGEATYQEQCDTFDRECAARKEVAADRIVDGILKG